MAMKRPFIRLLVIFLFVVSNIDLVGQPLPFSYRYKGDWITLSPAVDIFAVKLNRDAQRTDLEFRLQEMAVTISRDLITPLGDTLYLVQSRSPDPQLFQTLTELPGVLRAFPIFRHLNGKNQILLNTFVVKLRPNIDESEFAHLNRTYNVSIHYEDKFSLGGKRFILRHPWASQVDAFRMSYEYSLLPGVEYSNPDFVILDGFDADGPGDPYYSNQWNLAKVNAEGAWKVTKGSSSIKIAVLDDGVDLQHEDLVLLQLNDYTHIFSPSKTDGGNPCPNLLFADSNLLSNESWWRN
jgi:hypothetical protein